MRKERFPWVAIVDGLRHGIYSICIGVLCEKRDVNTIWNWRHLFVRYIFFLVTSLLQEAFFSLFSSYTFYMKLASSSELYTLWAPTRPSHYQLSHLGVLCSSIIKVFTCEIFFSFEYPMMKSVVCIGFYEVSFSFSLLLKFFPILKPNPLLSQSLWQG